MMSEANYLAQSKDRCMQDEYRLFGVFFTELSPRQSVERIPSRA